MFSRVWGVYLRYLDEHLDCELPGFLLGDAGKVEHARLQGRQLSLDGRVTAERLTLDDGDQRTNAVLRGPANAPRTFEMSHSLGGSAAAIEISDATGQLRRYRISGLNGPRVIGAKLRIAGRFAAALVRTSPLLIRYLRRKDPSLRAQIGPALGFGQNSAHHLLQALPFAEPNDATPEYDQKITIVLPVYNAFELVQECLRRVTQHTDLPWRLVIVEDASPDERVRPWLQDWVITQKAAGADVELLENPQNLGFIGSVNRAWARALEHGDHVVLLNSDALVPDRWAGRLMQPIFDHDDVASVTPMSNDAEIFTSPVICQRHDLANGVGDKIDQTAARISRQTELVEVPTGVGFCMGVNISFVAKNPELDTVFGRGYGEEVDWCQKARASGGRHVACPWLFVEHRGGESFGSDEKLRLIQKNGEVISARYPSYDRDVQRFIRSDPLVEARLALGLAWLSASSANSVPVYLAHSMGGGAEMWLQSELHADTTNGPGAVVLRVGGAKLWQIELHTGFGRFLTETDDQDLVRRYLDVLTRKRIVYSCGVGHPEMIQIPAFLAGLAAPEDRVEVMIHDYLPLSPSQTLLDHDNVYRGPVRDDTKDTAHHALGADGQRSSLQAWRASWAKLMVRANEVRVFSDSSMVLVRDVYPQVKLSLKPHALLQDVQPISAPAPARRVVGVLGSINIHKGAEVVTRAAKLAAQSKGPAFVIIGTLDPAVARPRALTVHGAYAPDEIAKLAAKYGITDWLVPSIWPETFSYVTHEALATGLPVYAFEIGAQGNAVRAAPNGHVIPMGADLAKNVLDAFTP